MSRTEKLLNALIDGQNIEDYEPQSRIEILLKRICLSENCDDLEPKSGIEYLLKELSSCVGGSGGSEEDMLQARIDINNSCYALFCYYKGATVDYIKNLDTSKITDMTNMFQYCSNLTTIPQLNTSNVGNMSSMFINCYNLTSIPLLDTSKVTDMSSMFGNCYTLTTIPQLNTSKVTNMSAMFSSCYNYLTTIPQLNTSKVTNMNSMFKNCLQLKSILMYGMKVKFDISASTLFEASDLVTILSNCQVLTSSQTLTMGSTNLAKLNGVYVKPTGVELYEGITCNPCVICESTDEGAILATDYFTAKGWTLA